ncbi:MAG: LptF/LptG family permease [Spirochaetaceae bacterium]|jgi:lipopolysaccharide export system permease protein|nr:LptF/LptG family permease [Spirochaetaceae bacterium]
MILDRYLVRQFLPVLCIALFMFMFLISLIDLFANLWRFLNYEVPFREILRVYLYYLPKSVSWAQPLSLLFAAAYTLGDLYGRNELTAVFSSGIPFSRFARPLLIIGIGASFFSFFFDDQVVIPTLKIKTDLSRTLLRQEVRGSNSDIVIKSRGGEIIYAVDYFDDNTVSLNGLSIIEKTAEGEFLALIRSPLASWNGEYWVLNNALIYTWEEGEGERLLRVRPLSGIASYREEPNTFKRNASEVESLSAWEAGLLVEDLKRAGLPFTSAQAEYYHRFSFPLACFVVIILSLSMGGRFKKNILLMSLLTSLMSAVVFYVMDMIGMMMARLGYIPPLIGAWFPVSAFIVIGIFLLRFAKT